jgi:acetoacetate decarboxylase
MGYKHHSLDVASVKTALSAPNFLLKIIPHVDGTPRICELVEYFMESIEVKGAWTGPAALSLTPHALAPVAECWKWSRRRISWQISRSASAE